MATLNIAGKKITIDDAFLKLPPDQQQAQVDEIAASLKVTPAQASATAGATEPAAPPDKYQQAAIDESADFKARGIPQETGFTRRLVHGATLGADNTLMGLAFAVPEMIKRGTLDPREGYNYAKAREDALMDESRKNTGMLGSAAEMLGGAFSGAGLAKGGVTAARYLPEGAGLLKRAGAAAIDSMGLGGFSGAMEGNGLEERGGNAVKGAIGGALVGGLLPLSFAGAGTVLSPIVSNIRARFNPTGYAQRQVALGVTNSGRSADDIALDVIQAANEGQGAYRVADAMGNAGQRLLSTVARAPGRGRTDVVNELTQRQRDQGDRLVGTLREGFETGPRTAEQTKKTMTDAMNFEAERNYRPVMSDTTPIDVSGPVNIANAKISPFASDMGAAQGRVPTDLAWRTGIESQEAAIADPIRDAVKHARSYLAAPTLTVNDVGKAFAAKTNIDQMMATAADKGQGALVRALKPLRDALDEKLAQTSHNYAGARDAYKVDQGRIGALERGQEVGSKKLNPQDTIAEFNALEPGSQQPFRAGYAEPQISDVLGKSPGANKADPFLSDAARQEFAAFAAPGKADMMARRIGREQTMFETRNHAMGGSKTADNLADEGALGVDPSIIGHILTGNIRGAVTSMLRAGANGMTGNTAQVREEVGKILMQRGGNMRPDTLRSMVDQVMGQMQRAQDIARGLTGAGAAGVSVALPGATSGRRSQ